MRRKSKLAFSPRSRRTTIKRYKPTLKKYICKGAQQAKETTYTSVDDRPLNLTFDAIPFLDLNQSKEIDTSILFDELNNISGFLNLNYTSNTASGKLIELTSELDKICKETNSAYFIGKINEKDAHAIVFVYEYPELSSWLAPRLCVLPLLRKRSKNWYNVVVNSFQILTKIFLISDSTKIHYSLEWLSEEIDNNEYESEDYYYENLYLLNSYNDGEPREFLDLVEEEPTLNIDQCIRALEKFPLDLLTFALSIIDLLKLASKGKNLLDYDLRYSTSLHEGIYEECVSIDTLFSWIYDYDRVCEMTEEYIQCETDNSQIQPPSSWLIIHDDFKSLTSKEELKEELLEFAKDNFSKRFDALMVSLCHEINSVIEKQNERKNRSNKQKIRG